MTRALVLAGLPILAAVALVAQAQAPPAPVAPAPVAPAPVAPAPVAPAGPSAPALPAPVAPSVDAAAPASATAPAAPAPPPPPPPGRASGTVKLTLKSEPQAMPAEGAVVYLERVDRALWGDKRPPVGSPKVVMKDKKFEPRTVPVLAGRSVSFPNNDPVFHNAFSLSAGNKFDLGLYKDGKSKTQQFEQPGVVRIFCNIHPSMAANVLVLQNPWWSQVGADGTFALADIPPGAYTLKVWHERGGQQERAITVAPGQKLKLDFELDGRKYKVVPHLNKFGKPYGDDSY